MTDLLIWTSLAWSLIFGGTASQVVGYLIDRKEYQ